MQSCTPEELTSGSKKVSPALRVFVPQAQWEREDDPVGKVPESNLHSIILVGQDIWFPYDRDQNEQIEMAYLENKDCLEITGDKLGIKNGFKYMVYFHENGMYQQNTQSGFRRKIRRWN